MVADGYTRNWLNKKLGDECDLITKGTTPTSIGKMFLSSGVNFVKVESLRKNGLFMPEMFAHIDKETHNILNRSKLQENDMLISIAGALGRVGIVDESILPANTNQAFAIARLKTSSDIDLKYLFYYLNTKNMHIQIESMSSQGAQPNLSLENIYNLLIVFPPKAEQKAIATALSDTDALIDALEKLIAKKEAIKTGTMQELLTGKKRLDGFSGEWVEKRLGDIAEFYKGKGLSKSELTSSGMCKCIHYGELFTTYKESIEHIDSYTNKTTECFYSKENDVLMPTSDVTPNGLATASSIHENKVILGGDILVIRAQKNILNGVYLSYYISNNKEQIMKLVSGSTVYHLYGSDMANLDLYMPSIKEQTAIATILSDMDKEIETLKSKLSKLKAIKEGMMQELLSGKTRLLGGEDE